MTPEEMENTQKLLRILICQKVCEGLLRAWYRPAAYNQGEGEREKELLRLGDIKRYGNQAIAQDEGLESIRLLSGQIRTILKWFGLTLVMHHGAHIDDWHVARLTDEKIDELCRRYGLQDLHAQLIGQKGVIASE